MENDRLISDAEAKTAVAAIQAVLQDMLIEAQCKHGSLTTADGAKFAEASSVLRHLNTRIEDLRVWIEKKTAVDVPIKFVDKVKYVDKRGGTRGHGNN
jgi:hypothetical protein